MWKIKQVLLYGGLERDTYYRYKNDLVKHDAHNLSNYLIVASAAFFLLSIAAAVSSGFAHINTVIYLCTTAAFGILTLVQRIVTKKKSEGSTAQLLIINVFVALLYVEAILLTLMHRDMPAVTYIGVMLMLPLIFAQSPINMVVVQVIFMIIFCLCSAKYKPAEIAAIDIWNGITFFGVSLVVIVIVIPMRISNFIQTERIKDLSAKDLLTGLKNRNSFETDCRKVARMLERPICIYADVNGLHELNNTHGHPAGDAMLRAVAEEMKTAFGDSYSYRIGGDEFLAFVFGMEMPSVEARIQEMVTTLQSKGYHVSVGCASATIAAEGIDKIVRRAETKMFAAKRVYYQTSGNDRRSR